MVEAMSSVSADPDELAYFALTSKPEAQIRDRLAYQLHRQLGKQGRIVAREWKRTDLAVLESDGKRPLALIEAKALLSADLQYSVRVENWRRRVRADIRKAAECADGAGAPEAEIYALVIATHVLTKVRSDQRGFVKYGVRLGNVTAWEEAKHRLSAFLPESRGPHMHSFGRGEAFGIEVEVTAWLFGPVQPVPDPVAGSVP